MVDQHITITNERVGKKLSIAFDTLLEKYPNLMSSLASHPKHRWVYPELEYFL